MNKVVVNVLKRGMDKLGDSMIEKACPFILYQPKACARKAVPELLIEMQPFRFQFSINY